MSDEGCPQTDWQTDCHLSNSSSCSQIQKWYHSLGTKLPPSLTRWTWRARASWPSSRWWGARSRLWRTSSGRWTSPPPGASPRRWVYYDWKNSDRGYLAANVKHPGSLVQTRESSNISMHQISCLCLTYQSSLIFYWLLHFQIRTRGEWLMVNLRFDFCRIF